jgi:hypothetical protein
MDRCQAGRVVQGGQVGQGFERRIGTRIDENGCPIEAICYFSPSGPQRGNAATPNAPVKPF